MPLRRWYHFTCTTNAPLALAGRIAPFTPWLQRPRSSFVRSVGSSSQELAIGAAAEESAQPTQPATSRDRDKNGPWQDRSDQKQTHQEHELKTAQQGEQRTWEQRLPLLLSQSPRSRVAPPVVFSTSGSAANSHTSKVHILGIDEKSKFLAHVLRDTYDRVEFVSRQGPNKYKNIVYDQYLPPVPNRALEDPQTEPDEEEPITNLVITDATIGSLRKLKRRLDDRSTICVVQDGLGFAEQAAEDVFKNPKSRPTFLLGHMPRSYQYDRRTLAVRQMPRQFSNKSTYLTRATSLENTKPAGEAGDLPPPPPRDVSRLVHSFESSDHLNGLMLPFDHWLKMKLPSMVFACVVDPVCTVLNCRYEQLMDNNRGLRMMDQLLTEISAVILSLPEIQASPEILSAFSSQRIRQYIWSQIRGKGQAASMMAQRVQSGKWTDVNYLNGYFVRKGELLGIDVSANRLAMNIVKAAMYQRRTKIEAYVPWEETSRMNAS